MLLYAFGLLLACWWPNTLLCIHQAAISKWLVRTSEECQLQVLRQMGDGDTAALPPGCQPTASRSARLGLAAH